MLNYFLSLNRILLLLVVVCLLAQRASGQGSISGEVQDSVTRAPLAFASVFLTNTTRGTVTDEAGRFRLTGIPAGSYEIVVSYLGYRLTRQTVLVGDTPIELSLRPAPLAKQLGSVTIEGKRKNSPSEYRRFAELFLGNSAFSRQCRIRNPEGVRVHFDAETNKMSAHAPDFLQVDNQALGYRLRFYGLRFDVDFNTQIQSYYSWLVFEELPTDKEAQRRRWAANRRTAYYGSLTHFLRSLRDNTYTAEGFSINRIRRVPNRRWVLADSLIQAGQLAHAGMNWQPHDSLRRMHQEPRIKDVIYPQQLQMYDLLSPPTKSGSVFLRFEDILRVVFTPKNSNQKAPSTVVAQQGNLSLSLLTPPQGVSSLHLLKWQAEISPNGHFTDPLAVFVDGSWSLEKVGELLPLDYKPEPGSAP